MNTQKKTLSEIQDNDSQFIAPVKGNQPNLVTLVHEVEASSEIASHYSSSIKQSNDFPNEYSQLCKPKPFHLIFRRICCACDHSLQF